MQQTYSVRKAEKEKKIEVEKTITENTKIESEPVSINKSEPKEVEKKKGISKLGNDWLNPEPIKIEVYEEPDPKETQKVIQQYELEQKEVKQVPQKRSSFNRVKPFKEMNNSERINYLLHFPKQLPPVPCIFQTEETSFKGILINKNETIIEIKLLDDTMATIEIDQIKEIKMIGF